MDPRRLLALPVLSIAAAVAADRLLYDAPLGLGAALAAILGGSAVLLRQRAGGLPWLGVGLAGLLLLTDPGPLALVLAGIALTAGALAARGWTPDGPAQAIAAVAGALPRALGRSLGDLPLLRRLPGAGRGGIVRWAVPVLGAGVFIAIFAAANPILADKLSAIGTWLAECDLPGPARILLWWAAAGGLWLLGRARARANAASSGASGREPSTDWTLRCLAAFNLAFLVQNACDAAYLWAGTALPEGMTYATYAHRGAYPLVIAALLAGIFVLACVRPGGAAERSRWARVLVVAFLAQTVVLTASAWWRLDLYVDVYGLTRWRLAALVWMALIGIGLALVGWRIVRRLGNRWLVEANAWVVAAVLVIAALGDSDGLIVRYNVDRALTRRNEPALDIDYCASLGIAALPALAEYDDSRAGSRASAEAVARLRSELRRDLADWRGVNARRWLVARRLDR